MTDEVRRYIIWKNYCGETFTAIAAELEINPSTISMDRRRKKKEWEHLENWLELNIESECNQMLDEFINKCRERLKDLYSAGEEHKRKREEIIDTKIEMELKANLLKADLATEVARARYEKKLYIMLAEVLTERYNLP